MKTLKNWKDRCNEHTDCPCTDICMYFEPMNTTEPNSEPEKPDEPDFNILAEKYKAMEIESYVKKTHVFGAGYALCWQEELMPARKRIEELTEQNKEWEEKYIRYIKNNTP